MVLLPNRRCFTKQSQRRKFEAAPKCFCFNKTNQTLPWSVALIFQTRRFNLNLLWLKIPEKLNHTESRNIIMAIIVVFSWNTYVLHTSYFFHGLTYKYILSRKICSSTFSYIRPTSGHSVLGKPNE